MVVVDDDHALDDVFELPHIARPVVRHQAPPRGGGDTFNFFMMPLAVDLDEVIDQERDILRTVTQARQSERHHFQAMIQIFAERASADRFFQIAVGGRNDAHVDFNRFVGTDSRDFAAFQHTQKFDLRGERHVSHFVEKQCSPVGIFKLTDAIGARVGERPLHMAKKLAFQNMFAERGTIEGHEGTALAGAVLMNRLCDQLLSRAGIPLDQHRGIGGGDPAQTVDHFVHLRTVADHPFKTKFLIEPAAQLGISATQMLIARGIVDHRPQLFEIERLQEIIERPLLHRLNRRLDRAMTGDENHLGIGLQIFANC